MPGTEPKCPLCNARLEPGFVLDKGHYDHARPAVWVEGEPQKTFWLGTKTSGKRKIEIEAWRCTNCGYLMQFAWESAGGRK
ncbi:MAG: PF20097 family protein [Phycisphaerales bacterium]|nr:PF20097 family protein [Phycisphaerales bacterium]